MTNRVAGAWGAATVAALVLSDLVRRVVLGQSILVSLAPLLIASVGAAFLIAGRTRLRLPPEIRFAIGALVVTCLYASLISYLRGLPRGQIFAGWIAQVGPVPGLIVGYSLSFGEQGWKTFNRALFILVSFSIAVALLQQFGLFAPSALEVISGADVSRGLEDGGTFNYTSGPFRTANVFSAFLAASALLIVVHESDWKRRPPARVLLLLALILIGGLLAARRSGLMMMFGAIIPFLFSSGRRLRVISMVVIAGGSIYFAGFRSDAQLESDISKKVSFTTEELNVSNRLGQALDVRDKDWELVSASGDGIGSHGPATQAGGMHAFRQEILFTKRHPIAHVGWFKDLISLGPLGALTHLTWFVCLLVCVARTKDLATARSRTARLSGMGFLAMAVVNYYFVATSWLQSITGGLFFGLAIGVYIGRMRVAARTNPVAETE